MATIEKIWLATLTKNENDAGTDADVLNLTIDVNGEDMADIDLASCMAQVGLTAGSVPTMPGLTKVRLQSQGARRLIIRGSRYPIQLT